MTDRSRVPKSAKMSRSRETRSCRCFVSATRDPTLKHFESRIDRAPPVSRTVRFVSSWMIMRVHRRYRRSRRWVTLRARLRMLWSYRARRHAPIYSRRNVALSDITTPCLRVCNSVRFNGPVSAVPVSTFTQNLSQRPSIFTWFFFSPVSINKTREKP